MITFRTFILDILATLWTCPNTGAVIAVSGEAKGSPGHPQAPNLNDI